VAFKCIYCSAINELNKFGTPPNSGPKLFIQSFQVVRVSGTGGRVWGGGRSLGRGQRGMGLAPSPEKKF